MPDAPVVKVSLAERIAKLNAANATADRSLSPAGGSSSAPGQIRDKISRYEATGQGEAPLVPKGSFGLGAPMQPGGKHLDRMRIASLGVSGGLSPHSLRPGSPSGRPGSRSVSSSAALGPASARQQGSDASGPNSHDRLSALKGSKGGDAESVNSMKVEAQSQRSDATPYPPSCASSPPPSCAARDPPPERANTPPADVRDHEAQVEKTRQVLETFEAEETDRIVKVEPAQAGGADGAPREPPEVVLPSRSMSHSPSSRDIGSFRAATDLDQDLGSMALDDGPPVGVVGRDGSPHASDYQTSREEAETPYYTDDGKGESEGEGGSQYALLDILDAESDGNATPADMPQDATEDDGMPKVKCSDCGVQVGLIELADHTCAPPATTKSDSTCASPSTPRAAKPLALHSGPSSPLATMTFRPPPKDVPQDLEEDALSTDEAVNLAVADATEVLREPDVPEPVVSPPTISPPSSLLHPEPGLRPGTPAGSTARQEVNRWTSQSPASLRGYQLDPRRASWMDDDDDDNEVGGGTGYVTIVRSTRG